MPTPKIDYTMIGKAVEHYKERGFTYVEVPWVVEEYAIRMTLPDEFPCMEVGQRNPVGPGLLDIYGNANCLVGSAEQGFLAMDLLPGRYVGVTPCFRLEDTNDLLRQDMFMKVELFSNHPGMSVIEMVKSAESFFHMHTYGLPRRLTTADGIDLMHADIEIGSYGERTHEGYGRWVYGTGLAEPRFSVANALARVV